MKNKKYISEILIFIFLFFYSYIIGSKYIYSDQQIYREVYDKIKNYSLFDAYIFYARSLDSLEIVHFIIIWIGSRIIQKDILMSIINSILGIVGYRVLRKWGSSKINAVFIVFANYYFLILYFAAERLKFGFLLFGIALLSYNKKLIKILSEILSIFAHVQMIIAYILYKMPLIVKSFNKIIIKLKFKFSTLIVLSGFIVSVILIRNQLVNKIIHYYYVNKTFMELIKSFIFIILCIYYSKRRKIAILQSLFIIFSVLIVGSTRVNIFLFYFLLFNILQNQNKKGKYVLYILNVYYLINSILFIKDIIFYGRSFL